MRWIPYELGWRSLLSGAKGMGPGSYAIIAILLGLLIWTGILAGKGWSSAVGTEVPVAGYVAMAIGVVFSVLLGVGLMALVFYSSRAGYDEPAKLVRSDGDKTQE
jgi:membrane protein DedA with SNARE-associated domain